MKKIPTLFDRDWDGHRGVVPKWSADAWSILEGPLDGMYPTEKLDGTNVRVTIRGGVLVRIEARMNPPKALKKAFDISEPWYRDAWVYGGEVQPQDRYIQEAALNTFLEDIPDGEWSAEAVGPKIQGNPLGLPEHRLVFFDVGDGAQTVPGLEDCPSIYYGNQEGPEAFFGKLCTYLIEKRSALNPDVVIEGIVWHNAYGDGLKIKGKDYK